jgi:hypothetical protein
MEQPDEVVLWELVDSGWAGVGRGDTRHTEGTCSETNDELNSVPRM